MQWPVIIPRQDTYILHTTLRIVCWSLWEFCWGLSSLTGFYFTLAYSWHSNLLWKIYVIECRSVQWTSGYKYIHTGYYKLTLIHIWEFRQLLVRLLSSVVDKGVENTWLLVLGLTEIMLSGCLALKVLVLLYPAKVKAQWFKSSLSTYQLSMNIKRVSEITSQELFNNLNRVEGF